MNMYKKPETYLSKYPAKVRIYLSSLFALVMLYNIGEMLSPEFYTIMLIVFVLAPIVIYYFTTLIFPTKGQE